MTTIVVTVATQDQPLPAGVPSSSGVQVSVTDNSGAALPTVLLNGLEPTPWTVTFTGTAGAALASAVLQALDNNGAPLGAAISISQAAPATFKAPTSASTITVS